MAILPASRTLLVSLCLLYIVFGHTLLPHTLSSLLAWLSIIIFLLQIRKGHALCSPSEPSGVSPSVVLLHILDTIFFCPAQNETVFHKCLSPPSAFCLSTFLKPYVVEFYCYPCVKLYTSDFACVSVPQQGTLFITTEFGKLKVEPLEICVIQVCLDPPS